MNIDLAKAVADIGAFLKEAGDFALSKQRQIKVMYKEGNQALTEADLAVSRLAQERLSSWLSQPGHVLIDEESIQRTPDDIFASTSYQWVLDPIDGTAGYALGRKLWGVSLGLLHQGRPVAGGIYLPAAGYFLMSDGQQTFSIDPVTGSREVVSCQKMDVHSQIFVDSYLGSGMAWGTDINNRNMWINTPESAVQGAATTLLGQSAATVIMSFYSIWDAAGMMALARTAGFKVLNMNDGREWLQMGPDDFKPNWKLQSSWLVCHPDNFDMISGAIKG